MGTASKPTAATAPSPTSPGEIEALVRSFYSSLDARQLDRAAAVIANDCEWTDVPMGVVLRGPKDYLEYMNVWLKGFSDGRVEVLNLLANQDMVTAELIVRGTHDGPFPGPNGETLAPTGRKTETRCVDVFQIRGGKIIRGRSYYDVGSVYRQLGTGQATTVVRKSGDGTALWFLGGLYEVKLASTETGGSMTAMEMTLPPENGPPPHTHPGEETVYVLEGRVRYRIGDQTHEGGPGTIFHVPRGTMEHFRSIEQSRVLVVYTPGGIEKFFMEAAEPAQRRELPPPSTSAPDVERIVRIGEKYGMKIEVSSRA